MPPKKRKRGGKKSTPGGASSGVVSPSSALPVSVVKSLESPSSPASYGGGGGGRHEKAYDGDSSSGGEDDDAEVRRGEGNGASLRIPFPTPQHSKGKGAAGGGGTPATPISPLTEASPNTSAASTAQGRSSRGSAADPLASPPLRSGSGAPKTKKAIYAGDEYLEEEEEGGGEDGDEDEEEEGGGGGGGRHADGDGDDDDDDDASSYKSAEGSDAPPEDDSDFEGHDAYKRGGYHPVLVGDVYGEDGRYKVLKKLGWGHFSTVWLCDDTLAASLGSPAQVALKIQKSASHYTDAAKDEIEILEHVENCVKRASVEHALQWEALHAEAEAEDVESDGEAEEATEFAVAAAVLLGGPDRGGNAKTGISVGGATTAVAVPAPASPSPGTEASEGVGAVSSSEASATTASAVTAATSPLSLPPFEKEEEEEEKRRASYRRALRKKREGEWRRSARRALLSETAPPPFETHLLRLLDHFIHEGPHGSHVCMVFEILGDNLLTLIKAYKYKGIPTRIVRPIMRDVAQGLQFLHEMCGLIHTDLKPENVLLRGKIPPPPPHPSELEGTIEVEVEMDVEEIAAAQSKEKTVARKLGIVWVDPLMAASGEKKSGGDSNSSSSSASAPIKFSKSMTASTSTPTHLANKTAAASPLLSSPSTPNSLIPANVHGKQRKLMKKKLKKQAAKAKAALAAVAAAGGNREGGRGEGAEEDDEDKDDDDEEDGVGEVIKASSQSSKEAAGGSSSRQEGDAAPPPTAGVAVSATYDVAVDSSASSSSSITSVPSESLLSMADALNVALSITSPLLILTSNFQVEAASGASPQPLSSSSSSASSSAPVHPSIRMPASFLSILPPRSSSCSAGEGGGGVHAVSPLLSSSSGMAIAFASLRSSKKSGGGDANASATRSSIPILLRPSVVHSAYTLYSGGAAAASSSSSGPSAPSPSPLPDAAASYEFIVSLPPSLSACSLPMRATGGGSQYSASPHLRVLLTKEPSFTAPLSLSIAAVWEQEKAAESSADGSHASSNSSSSGEGAHGHGEEGLAAWRFDVQTSSASPPYPSSTLLPSLLEIFEATLPGLVFLTVPIMAQPPSALAAATAPTSKTAGMSPIFELQKLLEAFAAGNDGLTGSTSSVAVSAVSSNGSGGLLSRLSLRPFLLGVSITAGVLSTPPSNTSVDGKRQEGTAAGFLPTKILRFASKISGAQSLAPPLNVTAAAAVTRDDASLSHFLANQIPPNFCLFDSPLPLTFSSPTGEANSVPPYTLVSSAAAFAAPPSPRASTEESKDSKEEEGGGGALNSVGVHASSLALPNLRVRSVLQRLSPWFQSTITEPASASATGDSSSTSSSLAGSTAAPGGTSSLEGGKEDEGDWQLVTSYATSKSSPPLCFLDLLAHSKPQGGLERSLVISLKSILAHYPHAVHLAPPPTLLPAPSSDDGVIITPIGCIIRGGKRYKKVRQARPWTSEAEQRAAFERYAQEREAWEEKIASMDAVIVDLGNACYHDRHFSEDIQTRQYRAPEVILGAGYDASADVWSLGAMCFELLVGDLLFDPQDGEDWTREEDHLALMQELVGRMPPRLALAGKHSLEYFDPSGSSLAHIRELRFWGPGAVLSEKYGFDALEAGIIEAFLVPALNLNPEWRATARECAEHMWLSPPLEQVSTPAGGGASSSSSSSTSSSTSSPAPAPQPKSASQRRGVWDIEANPQLAKAALDRLIMDGACRLAIDFEADAEAGGEGGEEEEEDDGGAAEGSGPHYRGGGRRLGGEQGRDGGGGGEGFSPSSMKHQAPRRSAPTLPSPYRNSEGSGNGDDEEDDEEEEDDDEEEEDEDGGITGEGPLSAQVLDYVSSLTPEALRGLPIPPDIEASIENSPLTKEEEDEILAVAGELLNLALAPSAAAGDDEVSTADAPPPPSISKELAFEIALEQIKLQRRRECLAFMMSQQLRQQAISRASHGEEEEDEEEEEEGGEEEENAAAAGMTMEERDALRKWAMSSGGGGAPSTFSVNLQDHAYEDGEGEEEDDADAPEGEEDDDIGRELRALMLGGGGEKTLSSSESFTPPDLDAWRSN